mgnify:CR=1 FL=1|jgi:hypothetical protein|nr:MAG TPA: hypothetical protein [Caudoviricetes sp.]
MTKSFKSLEKLERELRKEINKAIVDTINKFYSELKDNLNKKKLTSQIEDAIEISFENNKGIIEGNVKINKKKINKNDLLVVLEIWNKIENNVEYNMQKSIKRYFK